MKDYTNNVSILNVIWKWKYHILIITAIGLILSVIFSGPAFITPKFNIIEFKLFINLWQFITYKGKRCKQPILLPF